MSERFPVAERLSQVAESSTLRMNAAAKELSAKGVKVYNFAAGEPDFPPPAALTEAVQQALAKGMNKYTPVPGIMELRKAIAGKLKKDNGLDYRPEQVVVSSGAKQAVFNFLLAVVNPGDEVIIPTPYWVSYPEMVKIAGGVPVIVETSSVDGFKMSPAQLKAALTPRTRAVIVNSPSNPAGVTYGRREMEGLAKALEGTSVLVLSDEIYEKIVFEGEFCSFGAVSADAFSRTVTVNGFSKSYAITGWRLGYAAGPKPIMDAMAILQGQSTSGASSIVQWAGLAALGLPDDVFRPMVDAFRRRRAIMAEIFSQCEHVSFVAPAGAFYFFLEVEKVLGAQYNHDEIIATSDDLALFLLNAVHVSTVAGTGFGCPGHIRMSFACSDDDVREGAKRVAEALNQLMKGARG